MEKLEQYLDLVCRSIGGPKALREHVRQELREHLLDAVAGHQAAGLSAADALAKSLEEFGKPEDVRSELEATHGQRMMMALVIDKALEWKEKTMRAKWLWMTWACVAAVLVIALEVLLITFNVIFIIPKFKKLMADGMIDSSELEAHGLGWMVDFLHDLSYIGGHYTTWLLLLTIVLVGLFEWRVKSENKAFIRLSALGTAAAALMVVVIIMAGSLVIPFTLAMPAFGRMARPFALEQVATIDASIGALEQSRAKKEWDQADKHAELTSNALTRLSIGPAVASLTSGNEPARVAELRGHLTTAHEAVGAVRKALAAREESRVEAELARFHKSYAPIQEAAKRIK